MHVVFAFEIEGYLCPVRSQAHPYGIPGLSKHGQAEADEGTLHASRSAHMADAIMSSRPEDPLRPFATGESPTFGPRRAHFCLGTPRSSQSSSLAKYESEGFLLAEFTTWHHAGEYPKELCRQCARLVIRQFQRMAKAEFFQKRQEDFRKEVDELQKRTERRESGRSRSARRERTKSEDRKVRATTSSKASRKLSRLKTTSTRTSTNPRRRWRIPRGRRNLPKDV